MAEFSVLERKNKAVFETPLSPCKNQIATKSDVIKAVGIYKSELLLKFSCTHTHTTLPSH